MITIGDFERRMLLAVLYITAPVWALVYALILGAMMGGLAAWHLLSVLPKSVRGQ